MSTPRPTTPVVEQGLLRALLAHKLRALLASDGPEGFGCAIDVGAHHGGTGRMLRDLGHRGRIVSFEPHASSFAELERTSAEDPGWTARRVALGDADGEAELIPRASEDLSSLLANSSYGDGFEAMVSAGALERIPIARLDGIFDELVEGLGPDPLVLLKVDVQGSELAVLEGAAGVLNRIAAVQVELTIRSLYEGAAPWHETIALLEQAGFELSSIVPVGRDRLNRLVDADCLMIRPDALTGTLADG